MRPVNNMQIHTCLLELHGRLHDLPFPSGLRARWRHVAFNRLQFSLRRQLSRKYPASTGEFRPWIPEATG